MTRLLVFTENYNVPSGAASYIIDLCNGVGDLYEDFVFASNPTGFAADTSSRLTVPHNMIENVRIYTADRIGVDVSAATWLWRRDRAAGRLRQLAIVYEPRVFEYNVGVCQRLIRKTRPSAVLAYNGGYPAARSVLAMVVAARRERLPVALIVVSVPVARPEEPTGEWETRMDHIVGESADVIIVNAQAISTALEEMRELPASKMRVVHNAMQDRVFAASDGPKRPGLRIGCVSRMDGLKGTRFLVEAFATVVKRAPETELILVGDGPERENVERLIRGLGLQQNVTMTGHYPGDVNELVATFDIYAFPSLWEGLPYALLEAMRAGCPIVATDVGGISEAIIDEETGLLVMPGSAEELSDAIMRLIRDETLRVRLSTSARSHFLESFSLEAMHRQAVAVLMESGLVSRSVDEPQQA